MEPHIPMFTIWTLIYSVPHNPVSDHIQAPCRSLLDHRRTGSLLYRKNAKRSLEHDTGAVFEKLLSQARHKKIWHTFISEACKGSILGGKAVLLCPQQELSPSLT